MGFRGEEFLFESPAAAVAGMVARLANASVARPPETVPLDAARGRILAGPVLCDRDSPPFDSSSMDGYAVRAADVADATRGGTGAAGGTGGESITLAVVGEARVGSAPPVLPHSLAAGRQGAGAAAIRVVTGAAIPPGADAVVRREDVTEHAEGGMLAGREGARRVASISIARHAAATVRAGDSIRKRGENARAGETVARAGTVISAATLGTLAAVGCVRPRVYPRVCVAVITTGDELVGPKETPGPYQTRNSNAPVIRAVLESHAWIEVAAPDDGSTMHAGDEDGALDAVLHEALARADAVVLTGGVSMGHRDPVRAAVERVGGGGATIVFHGLPQRPGKPMLGAVLVREGRPSPHPVPIFGLPGNPISAMVTCTRIVLPVLAALAGSGADRSPGIGAPRLVHLANPDGKTLGLWWHRLVRINGAGEAELIGVRGSGDIIAGGRSDGFVELPPAKAAPELASPPAPSPIAPALVPFYPWPT